MIDETKIIFIIGAARSGTHLIANSLFNSIDNSQYLPEINEFWNKFNLEVNTDVYSIDSKNNVRLINEIRSSFFILLDHKCEYYIEKTAANSLRVDLLIKAFPLSKFIHVVRDGRDVVESVKRKVEGDPRKITTGDTKTISYIYKLKFLFSRSLEKINSNTFSLKYFFKHRHYYYSLLLSLFGKKGTSYWGPRYGEPNKKLSVVEYAENQWANCFMKASDDFYMTSFHVVNFNFLINNPVRVAVDLSGFLNVSSVSFRINNNLKSNLVSEYHSSNTYFNSALSKYDSEFNL